MSDQDFFSFDDALRELRLKEEELKRLVSEGEIRAFRDGETMKLRRTDVESLRNELSGGEVVDLGDASEDLVFEDDLGAEAGMATEEIADVDTIIEDDDVEDVGELELEEDLVSEPDSRAPAPRRVGAAAAAVEEEVEGMGVRFAMIATSLVLVLGMPIAIGLSTGRVSSIAKSIAGIFGAEF